MDRWLLRWVNIEGRLWKVISKDKSGLYRLEDAEGVQFNGLVTAYWLHRNEVENEKRGILI